MKLETITEAGVVDSAKKFGRLKEIDSGESKVSVDSYPNLTSPVLNTIAVTIGLAYTFKALVDLYLAYK